MDSKTEDRNYIKRHMRRDLDEVLGEALTKLHGERFPRYRRAWAETMDGRFLPPFPLQLEIETVDACNLKCRVCIRSQRQGSGKRFPLDVYKRIMSEAAEQGLCAVNFGNGGEPTLNPDISEMVRFAREKGVMDILMSTNGQVLGPEDTVRLVDAGLTRIGFSLDAATPETYAKVRGKDLARVESVIRAVLEHKRTTGSALPIVRVSFVRWWENAHETRAFVEKWLDEVDCVDVQDYYPPPPLDPAEIKDVEVPDFHCPQPWQRLSIVPDGDVRPCCSFYSEFMSLGKLGGRSLVEFWECDAMRRLRQSFIDKRYRRLCKNCYGSRLRQTEETD